MHHRLRPSQPLPQHRLEWGLPVIHPTPTWWLVEIPTKCRRKSLANLCLGPGSYPHVPSGPRLQWPMITWSRSSRRVLAFAGTPPAAVGFFWPTGTPPRLHQSNFQ
ncbi:hypothetical protein EX30DRAFT_365345 [Ascodesmis nigricans]|uniref:Uncharacterized protein n=1 Tax=Ascodesmis nigricans TaxID=341454 RepID=A0A4S2MSU5_9PEZI|nr:hypothetical protein EX30DRAFT_365345 [Ascodesmis nigricans]